jgi:hypothetical protein
VTLKTYAHLAGARRIPTEYEIVTTKLHYYAGRGFEVETPRAAWFATHQAGSALSCPDWDGFRDPRETTYTGNTALKQGREAHVDGLLRSIHETGYDARLSPAGLALLARTLSPARFPLHGLQMLAAYVGHLGPSGRITIVGALQAADELRRIERFAYRTAQLARARPGFGDDGRAAWQDGAAWQPLRKLIERLLVTYDWGEAFVALNLCLKPALDHLLMVEVPATLAERGDYLLRELCFSLDEDGAWQRQWSEALVRYATGARAGNLAVIRGWVGRWQPSVEQAIDVLAEGLADGACSTSRGVAVHRAWLDALGVLT